jgi:hypothetical protein
MALVTFTGDPRGGSNPPACEIYGVSFPLGIPVEFNDPAALARLANNSHFRVDGYTKPLPTEVAEAQAAIGALSPSMPIKRRGRQPKPREETHEEPTTDGADQEPID